MRKKLKEKVRSQVEAAWKAIPKNAANSLLGEIYERLRPNGHGSRNWNGLLLEELVVKFLRTEIRDDCIFRNKKLALIDDTRYDILLCSTSASGMTQSPICLSVKTSLRERYKQAEREG